MSRVLQAVDSIHQVGVYCLALVPPNYLPRVSLSVCVCVFKLYQSSIIIYKADECLPKYPLCKQFQCFDR